MEWKRKSSGVSQAGVPNELINISSNNIVRYVKYLRFLFMFFCDHKSLLNEYKKKHWMEARGRPTDIQFCEMLGSRGDQC